MVRNETCTGEEEIAEGLVPRGAGTIRKDGATSGLGEKLAVTSGEAASGGVSKGIESNQGAGSMKQKDERRYLLQPGDDDAPFPRAFRIRPSVADLADRTVFRLKLLKWNPYEPERLTLGVFVERALTAEAERLERELRDGSPKEEA